MLHHWYAISDGDIGRFAIDPGTGYEPIAPVFGYPDGRDGYTGSSGGYEDAVLDLRGFVGAPRLRLVLTSDQALADAGWYLQRIALYDGDVVPPQVAPVVVPADTQDLDGPYVLELDIEDDRAVDAVTLFGEVAGDGFSAPLTRAAGLRWRAELAAQPPDTTVSYWIEASDGDNVTRWPAAGSEAFRVFLAAPTDLVGPAVPHLVATDVLLEWTPPDTPHTVLGYRVHRTLALGPVAEVTVPRARVAVAEPQEYWVEALYDAGPGDPSAALVLDAEIPRLLSVQPDVAFQGQQLYVHLQGASLYLLDGVAALDFGPDVDVIDLDVLDADTAVARVEIAPDAAVGAAPLELTGTAGAFSFPDRFSIRDGSDAPHIVRVTPALVKQGDQVTVELEATEPFAGPARVQVDDDLVVTGDVEVDGAVVRFDLAVSGASRLGLHSLAVDDGVHLYTADLDVDETVTPLPSGCQGCSGGGPGGGWLALGLVALLRRQGRKSSSRWRRTTRQGPVVRRAGGRLRRSTVP
ncbi:MAG: hypothetical protein R3F59_22360 [Myxococcota bacterium]